MVNIVGDRRPKVKETFEKFYLKEGTQNSNYQLHAWLSLERQQ